MPTRVQSRSNAPQDPLDTQDVHYTFLIRAPFARAEFVDPPLVDWSSTKDADLWETLSRSSVKGDELDWQNLADEFDVDLAFLTQQAAWLYEKQLSQVRAQLRKANRSTSSRTSPTPDANAGNATLVGGHPMSRVGSAGSRGPSSLSVRLKERTLSHGESQRASSALSRRSSAATVTQFAGSPPMQQLTSEGQPLHRTRRQSQDSRRSVESSPKLTKPAMERVQSSSAIDSSSSSDSEPEPPASRSRTLAGRPRYAAARLKLNALSDAEEEEDDAPYLPFSAQPTAAPDQSNLPATVRATTTNRPQDTPAPFRRGVKAAMQTVYSSSSSNQSQALPSGLSRVHPPPRSPQQRRLARETGSDEAASMGSSFSDLDDASVTQSALEEAMAGEMQTGGMASRMSTISQALRSRYL